MARTQAAAVKDKAPERAPPPGKPAVVWPADKVERRKLDDLKPYPRNPRVHSPEQVEQIAASMREWGWTTPILVDEDGMILAGHGRVMAAHKLGWDEGSVIVMRGLSDDQKRALVIADNKIPENAQWDEDLLKLELGELKLGTFDLTLTGFNADSLVSWLNEGGGNGAQPPAQFRSFDENVPTEHQCPKCGYKWSGSSAAPKED